MLKSIGKCKTGYEGRKSRTLLISKMKSSFNEKNKELVLCWTMERIN